MNYKVVIQKTDEIVNNMDIEELRNCIHAIARKVPETEKVHDYREVMEIGKEALDYLEIDLRIRVNYMD
ncbi:hypothetical protein [Sedimentibacter sp. MB31-C6]|uniref:hypothetical protein n=1 Tax=Sedimentibacter sp. MB31-C6 TaxID=3109366 RepID=UPI002DDD2887|nr:hypothetical protein [Sedimentibacter sp. MB36-C1]WSI04029.1 hypothetical protein U8307_13665 [Sedimentibacter sp. MB36-C1]